MPTLMQKIRLAWRGFKRRREDAEKAFLAKNQWSAGTPAGVSSTPAAQGRPASAVLHIDIDGLTIAYLDGSGRIDYYLDTETGDVIESNVQLDSARYKRVPVGSPDDDRAAFIGTSDEPYETFRERLATDRALERAWYNFRNNRAIAAIESWLREHKLR